MYEKPAGRKDASWANPPPFRALAAARSGLAALPPQRRRGPAALIN